MKKYICIIVVIVASLFITSVNVYGQNYQLDDINMHINLDEWWFTFTRYNLENNDKLDYLNITKDYLEKYFQDNNAYLDAIYYTSVDEYIELTIHKYEIKDNEKFKRIKKIENLKDAKEADIGLLGVLIGEEPTIKDTIIYKNKNGLYLKNYYLLEENYQLSYITIVNNQYFIINFTSNSYFDETAEIITDNVVDNIFVEYKESKKDICILMIVGLLVIILLGIYCRKRNIKKHVKRYF